MLVQPRELEVVEVAAVEEEGVEWEGVVDSGSETGQQHPSFGALANCDSLHSNSLLCSCWPIKMQQLTQATCTLIYEK